MRPELNVIVGALLNLFVKFAVETFKCDNNGDIEFREVSTILSSIFRSLAAFAIFVNKMLFNKSLSSVNRKFLLEIRVTFLGHI